MLINTIVSLLGNTILPMIIISVACIACAYGVSKVGSNVIITSGRQPEVANSLLAQGLLFSGLIESICIIIVVTALYIIMTKPF